MAALSMMHTGKSPSDAAQALSDVATRGSDAATTAERTIVDVASIIIMISALLSFKLAVYSYVNQVPEAVDTLLQIKEFLAGQQGDAIARRYLQEYKKYIFTFVMMKKALLTSFILGSRKTFTELPGLWQTPIGLSVWNGCGAGSGNLDKQIKKRIAC